MNGRLFGRPLADGSLPARLGAPALYGLRIWQNPGSANAGFKLPASLLSSSTYVTRFVRRPWSSVNVHSVALRSMSHVTP